MGTVKKLVMFGVAATITVVVGLIIYNQLVAKIPVVGPKLKAVSG